MDPSVLLFTAIMVQLSSTGIYFVYDYGHNIGIFGSRRNDTQRYLDGELWWWEVRDDDVIAMNRIKECNKFVANPDNSAIKSILCIIQSWKLKVKMDAVILAKDGALFVAQHKDFFLIFFSFVMTLSILKRAYERQKKTEDVAALDACSYKSPHFVKRPDNELAAEKKDVAKELMENWRAKMVKEGRTGHKSFYKTSRPTSQMYRAEQ